MRLWPLAFVTLLGLSCSPPISLPTNASWDDRSATFVWWGGEVRLPAGFTYRVDQGADTFEGHFTSAGGAVAVRHDIGSYAGARASKRRALAYDEKIVDGARVWVATQDWPDGRDRRTILVAVTFPDSGCANFFAVPARAEAIATIEFIAASFRPKKLSNPGPLCEADR